MRVMKNRRGVAIVVVAAFALLALAGVAWRSLPAAGAGEVLVADARAVAGPIRVFVAPWSARRVVRARLAVPLDAPLDLGQGSTWPVKATVEVRVDPAAAGAEARALLLGRGALERAIAERAPAALADAARKLGARALFARPAALGAPLAASLAAALPAGLSIADVEVAVAVPPQQARAAALAAVRTGERPPVARVLYIGLDAADWEIVDRLVAAGSLPTFARIEREGVRADLLPYNPMMSPLLWTTALTGRGPDEHGIADFTLTRGGEDDLVPMTSVHRKAPALWEILAAAGQPSGFVNHWATQPAEETPGALVSNLAANAMAHGAAKAPAGVVWPPDFLDSMRGELTTTDGVSAAEVRQYAPRMSDEELRDGRRFWSDEALRARWESEHKTGRRTPPAAALVDLAATTHNVEAIARRLVARKDLGVVSVYFEDIDIIGHSFMHLAPPALANADPREAAIYGDAVDNCYREQDAMLGRLIAEAGPDTIVIVHSDHGFQSGPRRPKDILPFTRGQPVEWHRTPGLFAAIGGPVRKGARLPAVSIFDVAPTILALRGLPPGENMPGRVRADLLEDAAAAKLPTERAPSWDALVAPRRYGDQDEEALAAAQEQALDQLRGLGYVDADKPNVPAKSARGAKAKGGAAEARPGATYYRNLATYFMNQDRFAEAESALAKANDEKPLPKTFQMTAEARAARGDAAGALAALEEGFAKVPDKMEPEAVRWLVDLALKQGDPARARAAYERYAAKAHGAPGVAEEIEGLLAESRGDRGAAKSSYLRALEADPRAARAAERFAALADDPSERARLQPYLERGLAADQRIDLYWQMLGLLAAERGDSVRAAECFHRVVELRPDDEGMRANEATAWLRAGRLQEARAGYEALARMNAKAPQVYVNLGSLRAQAGDRAGALAAWKRAVALGYDSPQLAASIAALERGR